MEINKRKSREGKIAAEVVISKTTTRPKKKRQRGGSRACGFQKGKKEAVGRTWGGKTPNEIIED